MKLNQYMIQTILYQYVKPIILSIADLIHLHIKARGSTLFIENKEDLKGDIFFVPYRPYFKKENINYVQCN